MSSTPTEQDLQMMPLNELVKYASENCNLQELIKCVREAGASLSIAAAGQQVATQATAAAAPAAAEDAPAEDAPAATADADAEDLPALTPHPGIKTFILTNQSKELQDLIVKYNKNKNVYRDFVEKIYLESEKPQARYDFLNSFCPIIIGAIIRKSDKEVVTTEQEFYISYGYFKVNTKTTNIELYNPFVVGRKFRTPMREMNIKYKSYENPSEPPQVVLAAAAHQCKFTIDEWEQYCKKMNEEFKAVLDSLDTTILVKIKTAMEELIREIPEGSEADDVSLPQHIETKHVSKSIMIQAVNIVGNQINELGNEYLELKYFFKSNDSLKESPIYKVNLASQFGKLYDFKTMEEFTENYYGKTFNRLFKPRFEVNSFGNKVINYYRRE